MKNIFKKDQGKAADGLGIKPIEAMDSNNMDMIMDGDDNSTGNGVGTGVSGFSTPTKPTGKKKVRSPTSNPLKKAFRNMKGRGGPNAHCRPPAGTPPITPSPTKGGEGNNNNLKVQILSSPSNDPMNSNVIGSDIDSMRASPIDFDSERAVAESQSEGAYSCSSDESSLFQTVFGMSCGDNVFEMDMHAAAQRLGLSTIPEDKRIHEWGTAPILSDGEESDEFFEGIGSAQDYYEMVLREEHDEPIFCMPCNDTDGNGNASGSAGVYGTGRNQTINVILQDESFEDVFEVDGGKDVKGRKGGGNAKGLAGIGKMMRRKTDRSLSVISEKSGASNEETKKNRMFKFTRKSSSKKLPSPPHNAATMSDKRASSKSPSRKNLAKMLHIKRLHKKKNKSMTTDTENADTNQVNHPPPMQKPKRPRWKCVHDSKTDRVYYYHTVTRQVTWERPKGFVEWRVATLTPAGNESNVGNSDGAKTAKKFFYNVITKETRWDMPEGFVQWKEVWDERSEKCYYYNVLTRATTWNRPQGAIMDRNGEVVEESAGCDTDEKKTVADQDTKMNAVPVTTTTTKSHNSTSISDEPQSPVEKQVENKVAATRGRSDEKLIGTNSMKARLGIEKSESVTPAKPTHSRNNDPNVVLDKGQEDSKKKGVVKEEKLDEGQLKLAKLLSAYCPDEKENNAQLLKLARGQETPIIVAIETLVEDTPFDELRLAIFSYVKATVIEMGEEPYDEKRRSFPRSSKYGSRPPLTAKYGTHSSTSRGMKRAETFDTSSAPSASYSISSRAMSQMTGNSGSTMPINNTSNRPSSRTLKSVNLDRIVSDVDEKHQHLNDTKNTNLDVSIDDIDTVDDSENQVKVVLDMKVVGDDKKKSVSAKRDVDRLASKCLGPVQTLKHSSTANVSENLDAQSSSSSSLHLPSVNETIESAYAGDCDDETDLGAWEEEDDVSALSDDCFSLEKKPKKKKITSKRESSHRKDITDRHAGNLEKESQSYLAKRIPLKNSTQNESLQYTSFKPNEEESAHSSGSGSIGYEEIPRANATVDVKTATARGHREVYSLSSWDDDTVTTNESDK